MTVKSQAVAWSKSSAMSFAFAKIQQVRHVPVKLVLGLVFVLVVLFDILTFAFYFLWQQPWKKWTLFARVRSIRDESYSSCKDNSIVQKSVKHLPNHFLRQCKTIGEALDQALLHNGSEALCIGYRELITSKHTVVDGKPILKCALTEYKWLNFGQFYERISRFGHGLHKLNIAKGDKVMIFAETCANWLICGLGIIKNGSVLVTLYSTLGDEGMFEGSLWRFFFNLVTINCC